MSGRSIGVGTPIIHVSILYLFGKKVVSLHPKKTLYTFIQNDSFIRIILIRTEKKEKDYFGNMIVVGQNPTAFSQEIRTQFYLL